MIGEFLKAGPVDNLRIGLFGGSFNPPHAGHRALAEQALASLGLDYVWWIVSPQNPLKPIDQTADFELRLTQTGQIATHPRFIVSDIEAKLGTENTYEMLETLAPVITRNRFVWLMGADSFAGLHFWNNWQGIPHILPLAVFDRPGWGQKALGSTAANALEKGKLPVGQGMALFDRALPAWSFVPMPLRPESSSHIRQKNPSFAPAPN